MVGVRGNNQHHPPGTASAIQPITEPAQPTLVSVDQVTHVQSGLAATAHLISILEVGVASAVDASSCCSHGWQHANLPGACQNDVQPIPYSESALHRMPCHVHMRKRKVLAFSANSLLRACKATLVGFAGSGDSGMCQRTPGRIGGWHALRVPMIRVKS
jgi:hypothetical protein